MKPFMTLTACMLILAAFGLDGCFLHFYKTNTTDSVDAATIRSLTSGNKYFILHANHQVFALSQVKVKDEMIECEVDQLSKEHQKYLRPKREDRNKFPVKDKKIVLYEVHLYTQDSVALNRHNSVPVKNIYRLDAYGLDSEATSGSRVLSIIGITAGTAVVVGIIITAASVSNHLAYTPPPSQTGGSCSPRVYLLNKDKPELAGVLYSGAIFAPLERTDYLPLPGATPVANHLELQVGISENEEMVVHEAKLLRVRHSTDNNVLVDRYGKVLSYRRPVQPEKASIGEGRDVKEDIAADDGRYYSFSNYPVGQNSSDVVLDFKRPAGVHSGKLVIKARNSSWSYYVFSKFKSLYGNYYPTLQLQKDKADREKLLQCELDQSLPLSVSVKTAGRWKLVDYFFTPGNDAPRTMIMEIDFAGLEEADLIQIKLETTYLFWDLDYAGMDFSQNLSTESSYPAISRMWKSDSTSRVDEPDRKNIHITGNELLGIDFAVAPCTEPGFTDSYFLAGTGYYHDNTPFRGMPQLDKLAAFSSKGAFDKFSRQKFDELMIAIRSNSNKNLPIKN
jgi:hypothetical protein